MIPHAYFEKIKAFFNGDTKKTYTWFETSNPGLGGISPLDMLKMGREEKLKKFIDDRLEGNNP